MTYQHMIQRYTKEKYFCLLISNMPFNVYVGQPQLPGAELPYKDLKSHQSKINASVLAQRRKWNKRTFLLVFFVLRSGKASCKVQKASSFAQTVDV